MRVGGSPSPSCFALFSSDLMTGSQTSSSGWPGVSPESSWRRRTPNESGLGRRKLPDRSFQVMQCLIMIRNIFCLLMLGSVLPADVIVSLPLITPAYVDLNADPVVIIGTRTIDFTPNLAQEFIAFTPVSSYYSPYFRRTIAVRAADGLATLTGVLPPSSDPSFPNSVPSIVSGTTDLVIFDVDLPYSNYIFTILVTDLNGDTRTAEFGSNIPEPSTAQMLFFVFGAWFVSRRRLLRTR
jgi:hypothetical protein